MKKELTELDSLSDKREKFSYMHQYSEMELNVVKDELATNSINLQELEDEKKQAVEELNLQIKPIKAEVRDIVTKIKQKGELVTEDCYIMFDHENVKAEYFSPFTGSKVFTRPLYPEEMQMSLKFSQLTK